MIYNLHKKLLGILLAAAVLMIPQVVSAAGSTSIVNPDEAQAGETFSVTINGSESSTIDLSYNDKVLEFISCNTSYKMSGNTITFTGKSAKISFKAIKEGNGNLIVKSDTLEGSSETVEVAGGTEDTDPVGEDDARSAADTAKSTNGDYTIDGVDYVLSERFSKKEIPKGFKKTTLKIHGGTYTELKNSEMTLVYLKPYNKTEGKGVFYIFDSSNDSVKPMYLVGSTKRYVIVTEPQEALGDAYASAELQEEGRAIPAYQISGTSNDFYLIYGMSEKSEYGWYQYDSSEKVLQRANRELIDLATKGDNASGTDSEGEDAKNTNTKKTKDILEMLPFADKLDSLPYKRGIVAAAAVLLVIIILIIIDVILFKRNASKEEEEPGEPDERFSATNRRADRRDFSQEEPRVSQKTIVAGDMLEADDFDEANKPHHNHNDTTTIKMQLFEKESGSKKSGPDSFGNEKVEVLDFNDL